MSGIGPACSERTRYSEAVIHQCRQLLRVVGCPPAQAAMGRASLSRVGVVQAPGEETAGPETARVQAESLERYGDLKLPASTTQQYRRARRAWD
jgi:hypothetical protein